MANYPGLTSSQSISDAPGWFDVEQNDIQRQRQMLAQQLTGGPMLKAQEVSGHYVAPGWMGALADVLRGGVGAVENTYLNKRETGLNTQRQQAFNQWLSQMPQPTLAQPGEAPPAELGGGPPTAPTPGRQVTPQQMAQWGAQGAMINPMAAKIGEMGFNNLFRAPKLEVVEVYDNNGNKQKRMWDASTGQFYGDVGGYERRPAQIQTTTDASGNSRFGAFDPTPGAGTQIAPVVGAVPQQTDAGRRAKEAENRGIPAATATQQEYGNAPGTQPPPSVAGQGYPGTPQQFLNDKQQFSAAIAKANIVPVQTKLEPLESVLAKTPMHQLTGVGGVWNSLPSGLLSQDAQNNRQMIADLQNEIMRMQVGQQQTEQERQNVLQALGMGAMQSEQTLRQGVAGARRLLSGVQNNIHAGTHPSVVQDYLQQSNQESKTSGAGGGSVDDAYNQAMKKYNLWRQNGGGGQ